MTGDLIHLRQLLVSLIRRFFFLFFCVCLGCTAQSAAPSDLSRKIERQVRSFYSIPAEVKVTVGEPTPATEIPDYDSVKVAIDGGEGKIQDYTFLVSKDRNKMVRLIKFDLSKDPYAELMSKIDLGGRPVRGTKGSKVTVVNFDDFQCPFCSRMHSAMFPEILKEYGDRVSFVYLDYPLTDIHPWAMHAAVNANCLAAQNGDAYWDFADFIHANQGEVNTEKTREARFAVLDRETLLQGQKHNLDGTKLAACLKAQNEDAVKASIKQGDSIGVSATPALFVNGRKIDGVVPLNEIRATLDQALRDAGVPAPDHSSAAAPGSK
jgi:protein-disulfide isomerase